MKTTGLVLATALLLGGCAAAPGNVAMPAAPSVPLSQPSLTQSFHIMAKVTGGKAGGGKVAGGKVAGGAVHAAPEVGLPKGQTGRVK